MATKANKATAAPVDKSRHLIVPRKLGQTEDRAVTDLMAQGVVSNASLVLKYMEGEHGRLSLVEMVASLDESGAAVNRGDMASAERMLTAQASALNAIFSELARRAALNMGEYLDATDRYMRLALKAQSQCRATLETLATIKNPPVVFAKQANINNGGQQQVNNGAAPNNPPAPAGISESPKSELLGASDGQWMDTRAAGTAGGADPHLATVGTVNRPPHG